jgi:hypothetical protein
VALPCTVVLFNIRFSAKRLVRSGIICCLFAVLFTVVLRHALSGIDPIKLVQERFVTLVDADTRYGSQTGTRERDFKVEMTHWWEGTLIFGRGLAFFQTMPNPDQGPGYVAFGHLGYVTYLAQMGLVGLLIYGVYLPFSILRGARRLWSTSDVAEVRFLALLSGASITYLSLMFVMSSQFLSPGFEAPGVLYGSLWALGRGATGWDCASAPELDKRSIGWVASNVPLSPA